MTGELVLFDEARNFGNFDAHTYYNTLGIVAGISVESLTIEDDYISIIPNFLSELRKIGIQRIYEILGEEEGSLLIAMIFGDRTDMDEEQEEQYQKIGISHIFAISGLHISLLSLVLYQMLRKATGSFPLAGMVSSVFLVMYIIMIGVGISAIRAGVMFFIRVGGDITGRVYDRKTSLAIAALCIILPSPAYLYNSGFLLSFGAILGVIYLLPFWEEIMKQWSINHKLDKNKVVTFLLQGLGASLGIQGILLPVLLYSYYEVSPYSVVLNILVVPMMSLLLGIGMLGLLTSFLWYGLGAVLLSLSGWFLQVIDLLSGWFLKLPFARLVVGRPWAFMIFLYYLGIVGVMLYWKVLNSVEEGYGKKKKVAVTLLLLPILLWIHLPGADLEITMIDIGQGDCFYIESPSGEHYLIDGGSSDISSVGKYRIESFLRASGVGTLEYVFISHGDIDHINGIEEMLGRQELGVRIETLVLCDVKFQDDALKELVDIAMEYGTQVAVMKEGNQILDNGMVLTYLAPTASYEGELGNSSSMILELTMGEFQMLFTGDVEGEGEELLIQLLKESDAHYEVLKVSHHGSNTSTSSEFLEIVNPEIGFISAGVDSIYGHPHEEVLERLALYGCDIYATAEYGGVTLSYFVNSDTIEIKTTLQPFQ